MTSLDEAIERIKVLERTVAYLAGMLGAEYSLTLDYVKAVGDLLGDVVDEQPRSAPAMQQQNAELLAMIEGFLHHVRIVQHHMRSCQCDLCIKARKIVANAKEQI